jgi:hypothetical protein
MIVCIWKSLKKRQDNKKHIIQKNIKNICKMRIEKKKLRMRIKIYLNGVENGIMN